MQIHYRSFSVFLLIAAAACGDGPVTLPTNPDPVARMAVVPCPITAVDDTCSPPTPPTSTVPIYRWYHGDIGHLFGIDPNEGYQFGYHLEHNPSFYLFDDATPDANVQIFRCWRHNATNQHFMTTSSSCDGEANVTLEIPDVYGYNTGGYGRAPLYRLSFPGNGDDLVTTSQAERDQIIASGWQYRGILAYVVPAY